MRIPAALALALLASCGETTEITAPQPRPETFVPASGTWDGQMGEVSLTLWLQERTSRETVFGFSYTAVRLHGSGTYTYRAEAPDTFTVSGHRSGPGRVAVLLNFWGLGQFRGSMVDGKTITGTVTGGSPDLGYVGPYAEYGSPIVLRKR
jgi:hypothetical protein